MYWIISAINVFQVSIWIVAGSVIITTTTPLLDSGSIVVSLLSEFWIFFKKNVVYYWGFINLKQQPPVNHVMIPKVLASQGFQFSTYVVESMICDTDILNTWSFWKKVYLIKCRWILHKCIFLYKSVKNTCKGLGKSVFLKTTTTKS